MSYYSEDYRAARELILAKAKAGSSWRHTEFRHAETGADGLPLFLDVLMRGSENPKRILSICSGTHGAEGFCGSALQSQFIDDDMELPDDVAVFLVHAINPHGFSHMRRVTEDNVDLNRNFIDFSEWLPENDKYGDMHDLLNPSDLPDGRMEELIASISEYQNKMEYLDFFKAVSGGQYTYPQGVQFGGQAPTWSRMVMESLWRDQFADAELVVHLDVHTGLGPHGVGLMMMAANPDEPHKEITGKWFGDMIVTPRPTGRDDTIVAGYLNGALEQASPNAWVMPMTLEFGTEPGEAVLRAMIEDNWLQFHGGADHPKANEIKQRVRAAFYPDSEQWREGVLTRGREVFAQALKGLSEQDLSKRPQA